MIRQAQVLEQVFVKTRDSVQEVYSVYDEVQESALKGSVPIRQVPYETRDSIAL